MELQGRNTKKKVTVYGRSEWAGFADNARCTSKISVPRLELKSKECLLFAHAVLYCLQLRHVWLSS